MGTYREGDQMIFRDYKYLDVNKVESYLSSLPDGLVREFKETTRDLSGKEGKAGTKAYIFNAEGTKSSQDETIREATVKISPERLFYQLYEALQQANAIQIFDEDDPLDAARLKKGSVVEISRFFEPSPVNEAIDSLMKIMSIGGRLGLNTSTDSQDEEKIRVVTELLRGTHGEKETPMISTDEDDFSVLFSVKESFLEASSGEEEFLGDMTVFGKVNRVLSANESIDLLDTLGLLKALPRRMRRSVSMADLKNTLLNSFASFPDSLGGPIDRKEFTVPGPAVIITPVAVYTV